MKNILLTLAATAALIVGSLAVPETADAQRRAWRGGGWGSGYTSARIYPRYRYSYSPYYSSYYRAYPYYGYSTWGYPYRSYGWGGYPYYGWGSPYYGGWGGYGWGPGISIGGRSGGVFLRF